MYEPKTEKDIRCPLEYSLDVFGGKWKSRIICALGMNTTMRYSELKRQLCNITDTMLANSLKEMLDDGMVIRAQFNEIPPRVEYSLTEKGISVIPLLFQINDWGYRHGGSEVIGICADCPNKQCVS